MFVLKSVSLFPSLFIKSIFEECEGSLHNINENIPLANASSIQYTSTLIQIFVIQCEDNWIPVLKRFI